MGILVVPFLGQTDDPQHLLGPLQRFGLADLAVEHHHLRDLLPDGVDRVQRGHGILEDHADVLAADGAQLTLAHLIHVAALEEDLALDDVGGRRRQQSHDAQTDGGLARAGLAHKAQRLAAVQRQGDAIEGFGHAVHRLIVDHQVLNPKDFLLSGGLLRFVVHRGLLTSGADPAHLSGRRPAGSERAP